MSATTNLYAECHEALDCDLAFPHEVANVAKALAIAVVQLRQDRLTAADAELSPPRPK